MTQTQKQRWEQERAKGLGRFVLREGVLKRGLPFAVFLQFCVTPLCDMFTHHPMDSVALLVVKFVFMAVVFGVFVGVGIWSGREKAYAKPTDEVEGTKQC